MLYLCNVKDGKQYCVYVVTNSVNGMKYIGCHKTGKEWDGYLGSGKEIKKAIAEHGKEAFTLEVLSSHRTRALALGAEQKAIKEYQKTHKLYNIQHNNSYEFNYSSKPVLTSTSIRLPGELLEIIKERSYIDNEDISTILRRYVELGMGVDYLFVSNGQSSIFTDDPKPVHQVLAENKREVLEKVYNNNFSAFGPFTELKEPKHQEAVTREIPLEITDAGIRLARSRKLKGLNYNKRYEPYL